MSGYSSIFSSGLLATPRPNRHADSTPSRPDSPIIVDSDSDTTPTKLRAVLIPPSEEMMDYFLPRSRASSNASATSVVLGGAPRLRRRRSSLSIANNGLSAVKSPQRSAGIALQRSTLMGPGSRSRSGSTDFGPAGMPRADAGYVSMPSRVGAGRSRSGSGSVSGAMRSRRALCKPPPVPPPTAPLPPLPTPVAVTEATQRRPLMHRAHTAENIAPVTATLRPDTSSSVFFNPSPDFTNMKVMAPMGTTHPSSSPLAEISAL